jgi:hypothetical protein
MQCCPLQKKINVAVSSGLSKTAGQLQVMLFGAHPEDTFDSVMQVTVAYNHFGKGLTQRMPR